MVSEGLWPPQAPGGSQDPAQFSSLEIWVGVFEPRAMGGGLAQEVKGSSAPGEGGLRSQGLLPAVPLRERTQEHSLEIQTNRIHILPPPICLPLSGKVCGWVGLGKVEGRGDAGLRMGRWGLCTLRGCWGASCPPHLPCLVAQGALRAPGPKLLDREKRPKLAAPKAAT